jgi:sugar phosphate isomerase/epimerase
MFKLCVITDEVSQDLQRTIDLCKEFGVEGLEPRTIWDKPLAQLTDDDAKLVRKMADDNGMRVMSLASPFFKCDLGNQEHYDTHIGYLRRFAELCHMWDCKIIRGFTFWKTGPVENVWQQIIDAYAEPIRILEEEDLYIGIENEAATHIGAAHEAERLYKAIDSPRIRAIWDPANEVYAETGERPFPEAWERMKPWIIHIHIKDAVKDPESADGGRCVPIGDGGYIDYPGQFQALIDMGYEGACSLETHWRPAGEISGDLLNRPGGSAFSEGGEIASRICLENIKKIMEGLRCC